MKKEENGDIVVSDVVIGKIEGFVFIRDSAVSDDVFTPECERFIVQTLEENIDILINEGDAALRIENDFTIRRQGIVIARLKKSDDILTPDLDIIIDDRIEGLPLARLALHIQSRVKRQVNLALDPLDIVCKTEDLSEAGKEFVEKLVVALGHIGRKSIDELVRKIPAEERAKLRKSGVKFAQYSVFVRDILKPMAQETKIILWALYHGFEKFPALPPAGVVTVPYDADVPVGYYDVAGYKICGQYAVRADMIEKLADAIRPLAQITAANPKGLFEITPQHMSFVGKSGDVFEDIVKSLGYGYTVSDVTVVSVSPVKVVTEKAIDAKTDDVADAEKVASESNVDIAVIDDVAVENTTDIENIDVSSVAITADAVADIVSADKAVGEKSVTASDITETVVQKKMWFWVGHTKKRYVPHEKKPYLGNKPRGASKPDGTSAENADGTPSNDGKKFSRPFKKADGTSSQGTGTQGNRYSGNKNDGKLFDKTQGKSSSEGRKKFDKNRDNKKRDFNADRGDNQDKKPYSPYVNMPKTHKVSQENNPFAALLALRDKAE